MSDWRKFHAIMVVVFLIFILGAAFSPFFLSRAKRQVADPLECPALKVWYDSNNEEYFMGMLPADTVVEYGKPMGSNGTEAIALTTKRGGVFHIIFSRKYALAAKVSHLYLLHEQCHIITWDEFDEHGRRFNDCMDRLYEKRAFRGLL